MSFLSVGPFTVVGSFAFVGSFKLHGAFRFVWPFFTYIGSFTITWSPFIFVRPPIRSSGVLCVGSATDWQKIKQRTHRNDCNICDRETLKSSPTICRLLHCIHATYNMQKHCQKQNYVQNHINININIILLYR